MQMKKKYTINIWILFALAAVTLWSCSHDEVTPTQKNGINKETLQISMEFEDFGADEKIESRAAKDEKAFCDTVDISDNIEAEVHITPDRTPSTPATRANLANGHYTIVAYQGSNEKGVLKGTWDGTKFTPDASYISKMFLDPGTYTIICFNDKITHNGTTLTINRGGSAVGAVLGVNKNVVVSGKTQSLKFNMKNMQARVQFYFAIYSRASGYTAKLYSGINTTLASVNNTDIPTTAQYDVLTETWGSTTSAAMSESEDLNKELTAYLLQSDYHYFLPGTDGSKLKLLFNAGQLYGHSMANGIIKRIVKTPFTMQANKSYTINIKLHYKFTYLFSDGTTGLLAANPGKTPVGLVVDKNSRTAVALKDATTSAVWTTRSGRQNTNLVASVLSSHSSSGAHIYDGYNETWQASNSLDGTTVKGTSADFPAFKAAADYYPGVTTASTIGKWYLPAIGELDRYMIDTLSIGGTVSWNDTYAWAFTRAGGEGIYETIETNWYGINPYPSVPVHSNTYRDSYYSSSELADEKMASFIMEQHMWFGMMMDQITTHFYASLEHDKTGARVRAFVHY